MGANATLSATISDSVRQTVWLPSFLSGRGYNRHATRTNQGSNRGTRFVAVLVRHVRSKPLGVGRLSLRAARTRHGNGMLRELHDFFGIVPPHPRLNLGGDAIRSSYQHGIQVVDISGSHSAGPMADQSANRQFL